MHFNLCNSLFKMYTLEKKKHVFLMYSMYVNASNNTPTYTHVSSYMVWRVQPWPGIRGTQVLSSVRMKKIQESYKWLFLGNLNPEIESKASNESSEVTFKWIGPQPHKGAFFHWSHFIHFIHESECHESQASKGCSKERVEACILNTEITKGSRLHDITA